MIPASLQALKDAAASVQKEGAQLNEQHAEAHWASLLRVAQSSLSELWGYITNLRTRPREFPKQKAALGGFYYSVRVELDGHRPIYALFICPAGEAEWRRACYPGMDTLDVEEGRATWMVDRGDGKMMGFYQTLGAALLAAEER